MSHTGLCIAALAMSALTLGCGADRGSGNGAGAGGKGGGRGPSGGDDATDNVGGGFGIDLPDPNDPRTGAGGEGGPGTPGENGNCEPNLTGIVRDFSQGHTDFEKFSGKGPSLGIVKDQLGPDRKPVYAGNGPYIHPENGQQVTSPASFDQWYRDTDRINMRFEHRLMLTPQPNGVLSFDSDAFFPIDGMGFPEVSRGHNFHFTFELHTEFGYRGGEVFTFKGDDDLWVFINGRLALDLGGLHPQLQDTVSLDEIAADFGLEKGKTYPLELFHAERHTNESHFRIDTTIKFTNCNPIIID